MTDDERIVVAELTDCITRLLDAGEDNGGDYHLSPRFYEEANRAYELSVSLETGTTRSKTKDIRKQAEWDAEDIIRTARTAARHITHAAELHVKILQDAMAARIAGMDQEVEDRVAARIDQMYGRAGTIKRKGRQICTGVQKKVDKEKVAEYVPW